MLPALLEIVPKVLQRIADLQSQLAAAMAAAPSDPTALAEANAKATEAEFRVKALQETIDQLKLQDSLEESAIAEVITQFSAALSE
jgi:predicted  nucleic acid-binding Zn-ribbon protein